MALQMCSVRPWNPTMLQLQPHSASQGIIPKQSTLVSLAGTCNYSARHHRLQPMNRKERRRLTVERLRVSASAAVAEVGQVTEVTKDTFWPIVNAAGDKPVVLDMYTQWCGPCKIIAPKYEQLAEQYQDVVFLKLDCNQDNKPLAKELGIKVVPTFKILKNGQIVKEITGAKFDDLVHAIDNARSES